MFLRAIARIALLSSDSAECVLRLFKRDDTRLHQSCARLFKEQSRGHASY